METKIVEIPTKELRDKRLDDIELLGEIIPLLEKMNARYKEQPQNAELWMAFRNLTRVREGLESELLREADSKVKTAGEVKILDVEKI